MMFKGSDSDLNFQITLKMCCSKICEDQIVLDTTNWGRRISHTASWKKKCLSARFINNSDVHCRCNDVIQALRRSLVQNSMHSNIDVCPVSHNILSLALTDALTSLFTLYLLYITYYNLLYNNFIVPFSVSCCGSNHLLSLNVNYLFGWFSWTKG